MHVQFWGTRGSIPVAMSGNEVRHKLKQALLQANGRRFDSDAALERFLDEELTFATRHGYGGNSACVEIIGGAEYMICDMGSGHEIYNGTGNDFQILIKSGILINSGKQQSSGRFLVGVLFSFD